MFIFVSYYLVMNILISLQGPNAFSSVSTMTILVYSLFKRGFLITHFIFNLLNRNFEGLRATHSSRYRTAKAYEEETNAFADRFFLKVEIKLLDQAGRPFPNHNTKITRNYPTR